jgi:hypothetical protein
MDRLAKPMLGIAILVMPKKRQIPAMVVVTQRLVLVF